MMNVIKRMIFTLFYDDEFINAFNTKFFQRSLSQMLIQHNTRQYDVQFFLMMLNVFDESQLNSTQFLFNVVNIFVTIKLLVFLMKFDVIEIKDIVIFIFYRAQLKMYMINLRKLILDHSRLINVTIKTMNKMQEDEIKFVILNLMIHDHLNFLKLQN